MKIGIYKPFKEVFFHDDSQDNAAWSYEIVNMSHILVNAGHDVEILSSTDLQDGVIDGISRGDITRNYDRIIIFGGTFSLDTHKDLIIDFLRRQTNRLDFYLTDLKLVPDDLSKLAMFDNIYVMSYTPVKFLGNTAWQKYGAGPELRLFNAKIDNTQQTKDIEFYFGGTERGRLDAFLEYVWRPGHVITTKSQFLGIENRSERGDFLQTLRRTKYSICIADELFNENNYLTPRMYEAWESGIVCFVDNNYDNEGKIVPLDSWLRVSSYKEMKEKMNKLDSQPDIYNALLQWQYSQITPDKVDGSFVYNFIK